MHIYMKPLCRIAILTICVCLICFPGLFNSGTSTEPEWNFFEESRKGNKEDSCRHLLQNGSVTCKKWDIFLRHPNKCPISKSYWQPDGCNLHKYNTSEIKNCMNNIQPRQIKKEILMIGDSRVRFLFDTLKFKNKEIAAYNPLYKHLLIRYYKHEQSGIIIKFLWMQTMDQNTTELLQEILESKEPPLLILIGNALHPMRTTEGTMEGLHSYKANFTKMVPILERLAKITSVLWMIQAPVLGSAEGMNNHMVQLYNNVAEQLLNGSHVRLMYSVHFIGKFTINYYPDNIHLGRSANKMVIEIVLNYLCNKYIKYEEENLCCIK